ncbi:MAG: toxin-antitoxin system HicB family antitoxin [Singulisphaera sp.]
MPATVVHFQIRMRPDLHERLANWAVKDRESINNLIVGILERAEEGHRAPSDGSAPGPHIVAAP